MSETEPGGGREVRAAASAGGVSEPLLLVIVALGGAATMVVELGAVRVLAPWFGTSSAVWTNVIGVVLAALALGYTLGARLANREAPVRKLGTVLVVAGLLAAGLLVLSAPVANLLMPEGLPLHRAAGALVWGSLGCAAVLFLPAATALGCAGPLAVEALQRRSGGAAGAAGGRVLAASTLGSLVGTFGTTHWMIPNLGITATYLVAAAVLLAAGLFLIVRSGQSAAVHGAAGLLAILLGAGALMGDGAVRAPRDGEVLLAALESPVQSIRAVETTDPAGEPMRVLRVNESLDSFQSVWVPEPGLLPPGHYYNHFTLPLGWVTRERGVEPESWRVLILGLGAGTAVRVLDGVAPEGTALSTVGVEIDEQVLRIAEEHFDLERGTEDRVAVGDLDGRAALRFVDGSFDEIILDAYANNMEIPHHLATVEAFSAYRERLAPGGWMVVNVGGFGHEDPVVEALASSAAAAFGDEVHLARVPLSRNWVLFARKDRSVPQPGERAFGSQGASLPLGLASLVAPLEVDGAWIASAGGEPTLFDGSGSTETLQAASIAAAEARLASLDRAPERAPRRGEGKDPSAGDLELVAAATDFVQRQEFSDALAAAEEIEDPGTRGRTLADLHWRAGSPLAAFEIASDALQHDPDDLGLLAVAINSGFAVGADDASTVRLGRLREMVSDDPAWTRTMESYRSYEEAAAAGMADSEDAILRAQLALLGMVVGAVVAWGVVSRARLA